MNLNNGIPPPDPFNSPKGPSFPIPYLFHHPLMGRMGARGGAFAWNVFWNVFYIKHTPNDGIPKMIEISRETESS